MAPSSPFTTTCLFSPQTVNLHVFEACLPLLSSCMLTERQLPMKIHDAPAFIELLRDTYQATDYIFQVHLHLSGGPYDLISANGK